MDLPPSLGAWVSLVEWVFWQLQENGGNFQVTDYKKETWKEDKRLGNHFPEKMTNFGDLLDK